LIYQTQWTFDCIRMVFFFCNFLVRHLLGTPSFKRGRRLHC
jgi:hypothetical protein